MVDIMDGLHVRLAKNGIYFVHDRVHKQTSWSVYIPLRPCPSQPMKQPGGCLRAAAAAHSIVWLQRLHQQASISKL